MVASSPGPIPSLHTEKREGFVREIMCVTYYVERLYCTWAALPNSSPC